MAGKKETFFLLTYLLMGVVGFFGHITLCDIDSVPQRKNSNMGTPEL